MLLSLSWLTGAGTEMSEREMSANKIFEIEMGRIFPFWIGIFGEGKWQKRNSEVLFGVKAPSNLFSHLFINVKLSVASIEEYGTFERVYFSADEHLGLLVSILEASASIIVFLLYFFSLCC